MWNDEEEWVAGRRRLESGKQWHSGFSFQWESIILCTDGTDFTTVRTVEQGTSRAGLLATEVAPGGKAERVEILGGKVPLCPTHSAASRHSYYSQVFYRKSPTDRSRMSHSSHLVYQSWHRLLRTTVEQGRRYAAVDAYIGPPRHQRPMAWKYGMVIKARNTPTRL